MEEKEINQENENQVSEQEVVETEAFEVEIAEEQPEQENVEVVAEAEDVAVSENLEQESEKIEKPKKQKPAKEPKPKKKTRAEKKAEEAAAKEAEYANLTEDEIYTKIQTEKLVKRKKRNKIVTLISVCFAFVVAVTVIVMSAVPVSLKPKCIDAGFSRVQIYPGTTTTKINCYKDSERFNEFVKVYNDAFSQPYISALFSGTLFSYEIEENWQDVPSITNLTNNNTYVVHLTYDEEQTLTHQNGKVYKSNYYVDKWPESTLTFTDVWFTLSENEGMQETTVYIAINNYPNYVNGVLQDNPKTTGNLIKITVKGNTKLIYDACDDIEKLSGETN